MPVSGFHVLDKVRTPGGSNAVVVAVQRSSKGEYVVVKYADETTKQFRASALKMVERYGRT